MVDEETKKLRLARGECPNCGTALASGYGLAGGGMGPYMYCPKEDCSDPYFSKSKDNDDDPN